MPQFLNQSQAYFFPYNPFPPAALMAPPSPAEPQSCAPQPSASPLDNSVEQAEYERVGTAVRGALTPMQRDLHDRMCDPTRPPVTTKEIEEANDHALIEAIHASLQKNP
ncbi:hypothetical protein IHE33_07440 [Mycetohabitans endofungorum]|uniref:hypothetical protein n=1 Tax=Mycetohabitans endofungorum TaxID=417203 RepID=UPI0030D1F566